jgi:hypothetical protein
MKKYLFAIMLLAPVAGFSQNAKTTSQISSNSQGGTIGIAISNGSFKDYQPLSARGEVSFADLSGGKYTLQMSNAHEFKTLKCLLTFTGKDGKSTTKTIEGSGDKFGVGVEFDVPQNTTLTVGVSL